MEWMDEEVKEKSSEQHPLSKGHVKYYFIVFNVFHLALSPPRRAKESEL